MCETDLLIEYAKCWNNLVVSYIEELLGDDLEYTSQWVFETMYGKDNYLQYLSGKFNTIRNSINIPQAELGYYKYAYQEHNKPCLVITQGNTQVGVLVQVQDGKMTKIDMVGIPHPSNAILFDIAPK